MWNLLKGLRERGVNLLAGVLLCWAGFQSHPRVCSSLQQHHCSHVCRDRARDLREKLRTIIPFIRRFRAVFPPNKQRVCIPTHLISKVPLHFLREKEQGAGEIRAVKMWTGMFSGWNYSGHLELSKQPQTFFNMIFLMVKQQTHTLIKALI